MKFNLINLSSLILGCYVGSFLTEVWMPHPSMEGFFIGGTLGLFVSLILWGLYNLLTRKK